MNGSGGLGDHLLLFAISVVANFLSAFAGGGAGLLQLPALLMLGLPFGVALATHKVASVALGVGATLRNLRERRFELPFVLFVLGWGLPGVVLGASVILQVPDRMATVALGMLTLGLGLYSFFQKSLGLAPAARPGTSWRRWLGGVGLFVIGVLNGSLTSGTGLFVTLWLVKWFGLEYKRAVAYTLVLVGLFWNATGAVTLGWLGEIRWTWLPALLAGSLLGGYLGAHFAILKGNYWIKRSFETLCVIVGLKLVWG